MEILAKRIKELREERGLTQEALSGDLGLSGKSAIANYEKGFRTPEYETLLKIADYFNVSTDYLLGRTDDRRAK
ncbi:MAG TPA: helix-turn-helix transcriptional regulator [Bacillota bacterium]|nr:helix-turn-helix transcriptional regulator [Bacillota bacterium]